MEMEILQEFKLKCRRIVVNLPGSGEWQWDDQFGMVLVIIENRNAETALEIISREFDRRWDYKNINESPEPFYRHVIPLFGMIPGQIIFTTDETKEDILFAAWWPWGTESNVSLRIGYFQLKDIGFDKEKAYVRLSEWFELADASECRNPEWTDF